MAPKFKDGDVVLAFSGKWVSWAHTAAAYAAFLSAFFVGVSLHYHKIVQNEWFGYPEEWFPSVSATIGDRYPERSFFMLFIAITSGPRFALVGLWYLLTARPNATLPKFVAFMGVFRTLTCGGWTYVTSTDDHDWHDIFMISYLVATVPWTAGCLALSPNNARAVKYRRYLAGAFFGTLIPLVYFFIQHKVHRVAGAYTIYAFFEWALVLFDVAFDAVTALDFETFELVIKDVNGSSKGNNKMVADAVLEKEKSRQANEVFGHAFSWASAIDAAADVYNGFVFWSMLTSLGLVVWYFPLWHMGISGYEVMVMVTVSPFLLGIKSIRVLVVRNLRICHFLALSGLLGYLIQDPARRLFSVGFGVWMSCLYWAATWYSVAGRPKALEAKISAWTIGLILSSVVKFAFHTSNPIWPTSHAQNGGMNGLGFILAVLAVLRSSRNLVQGEGNLGISGRKEGSSVLAGFGIGGLFFALHSLLSDSSTMILWVWEGYPVRGPISAPHGALTIFAMGAGLVLGLFREDIARSWTAYGIGCVAAAVLTLYTHWTGFYGALILTVYLLAASVPLIGSAARKVPVKAFGVGFLVYNFMVLFHVWLVAYAFVPGGPLVREHTDWVMITTMLLIGCGVFASLSETSSLQRKRSHLDARKTRSYYLYILGIVQLMSVSIAYLRFPTNDYVPYHKDDKVLTAGIWTIHFSLDNDMWSSEYRMRDVIKELEIDVIGLLESDLQRIIMGNRDTTQFLAEDLGMYVDYGPGPNKHTWGAALLSKFPILNSTHHLLPSPVGELAPAIHATLDVYGELVDVFVFHSGQEEDPEDRRLQSIYLSELMGSSPRPSILLSYLVTKPLEGNYNTYVSEQSGMYDIDPTDWDRWCEYILYKGLKRTGYARVSRGTITDTEIQVGKFLIGEKDDEVAEVRNARIDEGQVPEGLRFPAMFRGEGVRGHSYHVFDEPRYYA
ncbi:cwh43 [Hyphodiscus hymeniophilus]|uniref:Cwh43 n=1 Tax=Hyphodiscus hymeniophilus TaxID=353542 RepID=A0A9P6VG35_9HELO|nr:cwh43 [Hyphodiscus hymeniophilus]